MQFSNDILIQIMIFVLGLCGFFVAKYIRKHKQTGSALVCPIGFDCHAVVHSDYSKFLGVPVELFGMIYYAIISLIYFFFIFMSVTSSGEPNIISTNLIIFLIGMSLTAFLFSAYLIAVQIFILKKGCSWCIVSAIICLVIFILTMFNYDLSSIAQIFVK